jgi:hypothetical protein
MMPLEQTGHKLIMSQITTSLSMPPPLRTKEAGSSYGLYEADAVGHGLRRGMGGERVNAAAVLGAIGLAAVGCLRARSGRAGPGSNVSVQRLRGALTCFASPSRCKPLRVVASR